MVLLPFLKRVATYDGPGAFVPVLHNVLLLTYSPAALLHCGEKHNVAPSEHI